MWSARGCTWCIMAQTGCRRLDRRAEKISSFMPARSSGAIDTVATVGICDVFPGAVNSIPARVRLSVDVRDTNLQRRDHVMRRLDEACRTTATKRNVAIHSELLNADAPADSGTAVVAALRQACEALLRARLGLHARGSSRLCAAE